MHYVLLLPLLFFLLTPTAQSAIDLPELGESANRELSTTEQRELGRAVVHSLQQSGRILNDLPVTLYLTRLGERLTASRPDATAQHHYFVIHADSINAFAIVGGFLGFHSGLILASERESELAAVMAHELTHLHQNHLLRAIEKANSMQLPLSAAILAAILLGNAQESQAVIASALATSQQMQLNFSRLEEQEADRIGIEQMQRAGFVPEAMASFFERLQNASRFYTAAPEFLSTHPITPQRIGDALNRAALYPKSPPRLDSDDYAVAQARLRVLTHSDRPQLIRELLALPQPTLWQRYTLAFALEQQRDYVQAQAVLKPLAAADRDRIPFQLLHALIAEGEGATATARQIYADRLQLHPEDWLIRYQTAEFELRQGAAQQARDILLPLTQQPLLQSHAYQLLARIEAALNRTGHLHLARAIAALLEDQIETARLELQLAHTHAGGDFYLLNRIEAYQHDLPPPPERATLFGSRQESKRP